MSGLELQDNHIHDDELISLRISSCLHSYDYKIFLCHGCPEDRLFVELRRAINADSTWWAPSHTLVITGRQGTLTGDAFKWDDEGQMEDLRARLLVEVQYDREMLLAIHRTAGNWRFVAFIIAYLAIVAVLVGIWAGLGHGGAGGAVISILVSLFAAYFHEIVRVQRH